MNRFRIWGFGLRSVLDEIRNLKSEIRNRIFLSIFTFFVIIYFNLRRTVLPLRKSLMQNRNMYILAIDQGTSSTKTLIFDAQGKAVAKGSEPLKTMYLKDGFVEQNPEDIYQNVLKSAKKCLKDFKNKGFDIADIKTCGISNQRETFVIWDKNGKPLHNAIVWQCKRSITICERLKKEGYENEVK